MTKKDVHDAYAPIAPTPEQKEKMWNAIMQAREQRPVQTQKHTVKQSPSRMQKRRWTGVITSLASLAAVLAVIVWLGPGIIPKSADTTAAVNETAAEAAMDMEEAPSDEAMVGAGTPEGFSAGSTAEDTASVYADTIETYRTAFNEGWTAGECAEAGISMMIASVESLDDIGYYLTDLDGDGDDELIITNGTVIYDLYVIRGENNELIENIASGFERVCYWLCEDNKILNYGADSAAKYTYYMYRLANGYFVAEHFINYDPETYPDAPWRIGFDMTASTEEEVQALLDSYQTVEIPFTPLSQQ